MRTLLLPLALVFLGNVTARASLGETDAQVEARYGTAKGGPHPGVGCYWKLYAYRSMRVTVIFIDGKSEYEQFSAQDRFSAADVKELLAANARNGSRWYRPDEEESKLGAEPKSLSLLFDQQEIANASISDYAVFMTSVKYEKLHLHAGNDRWTPERLNVSDGSPR